MIRILISYERSVRVLHVGDFHIHDEFLMRGN
jgi:hypothetical protein